MSSVVTEVELRDLMSRAVFARDHGFALESFGDGTCTVTAELKTTFLRAARREAFRCTARVLKLGRRMIFGLAECVSDGGELLTHHTVTYFRPDSEA